MKKTLLIIALGLALTACGGGGSNGGTSSGNTSQNILPSVASSKSIDMVPTELKTAVTKAKIVEVTDDGKTVKLDIANENTGFIRKNLKDGYVTGYNQIYSVVGAWLPYDAKIDSNGVVTDQRVNEESFDIYGLKTTREQLPKAGMVVYSGISRGAIISGKLHLDVDFAEKSVSGKLYDRKKDDGQSLADIVLHKGSITYGNANIENKDVVAFEGQASYNDIKGQYLGAFFGPNAEEVAGAVGNEDIGIFESFAGKK